MSKTIHRPSATSLARLLPVCLCWREVIIVKIIFVKRQAMAGLPDKAVAGTGCRWKRSPRRSPFEKAGPDCLAWKTHEKTAPVRELCSTLVKKPYHVQCGRLPLVVSDYGADWLRRVQPAYGSAQSTAWKCLRELTSGPQYHLFSLLQVRCLWHPPWLPLAFYSSLLSFYYPTNKMKQE